MKNLLEQAASFLGEQDLPGCESIQDSLKNLKYKLEVEGIAIEDDMIDSDDPCFYAKIDGNITIKFGEPDIDIEPWDDPELVQIEVFYSSNLSYPDESEIIKWYEINDEMLYHNYTE